METYLTSVEEIGDHCFCDSWLKVITFEKGSRLKVIGDYPFREYWGNIEIAASVQLIGDYCFNCKDIESIIFEKRSRLRWVSENAFPGHLDINILSCPMVWE